MPYLAHPWILLAIVPLTWFLWKQHKRRQPALRFPSVRLVDDLPPGRARYARHGIFALRCAGLCLLLIALAGPRWPDPDSRVPSEGISIVLVVDVSDSMKQQDFRWGDRLLTRLEAAKKVVHLFVEGGGGEDGVSFAGRPTDLIGLVTFAHRPETDCPPTLDHQALLGLLDEEYPRLLQSTNPGDALAWALKLLENTPTRRKVVLFLTDGEDNVPDSLRPRQAARIAAALEIPIYAVESAPPPSEKDGKESRAMLEDIARLTSGAFFPAGDRQGLLNAYAQIDRLEKGRIETFHYRRYDELDSWFAVACLALLLLLLILESTLWRTVP